MFLLVIHHLLLVLLLILGAFVSVCMMRGRIVETLGTAAETALLWYVARMLATGMGDHQVALVSYAPFIGIAVGFVLMVIGLAIYEALVGLHILDLMPARLRRALIWLYAAAETDQPNGVG